MKPLQTLATGGLLVSTAAAIGISLDPSSNASLINAAKIAATGMMKYYHGDEPGQTPGLLPAPYYWWEAGGMFGQLLAYSNLTGDHQYDALIKQGLLFQIGDNSNYMPANQTSDLGNDDQVFWAFAAMDAAEMDFSNPGADQPSWLALAQAVFNSQVPRWDTATCGGGLRWQIYPFNAGFTYKNSVSTGGLFQLAARLARYTGNQTYADWADKTYDWLWDSSMMNHQWYVWDGFWIENCSAVHQLFWTYNVGTMIMGSAYMYDYTQSEVWKDRLTNLLETGMAVFFVQSTGKNTSQARPAQGGTIMSEVACEGVTPMTCNTDEPSFKAYLARWLHMTQHLAPFTSSYIKPLLNASAVAAAQQCSGSGLPGQYTCGRRWYQNKWDGTAGVGEQMSAMSIFLANLGGQTPLTAKTGGTSKGNPSAGSVSDSSEIQDPIYTREITTGDRVGAYILTGFGGIICAGTAWFMIV